jgi:uncharacterized damage-inducible protein DinB
MTRMFDAVRRLDAYTRWADARLLEALPADAWLNEVGGSFGTLRNTAVHLVSAEWVWVSRWLGRPPAGPLKPEDVESPAALRARWEDVARDRAAFVARQTDATLAAPFAWSSFDGKAASDPLVELFLQMATHSTYHRGQLAAFLRDLGVKPPSTDYLVWIRSGKP